MLYIQALITLYIETSRPSQHALHNALITLHIGILMNSMTVILTLSMPLCVPWEKSFPSALTWFGFAYVPKVSYEDQIGAPERDLFQVVCLACCVVL